MKRILSLLCFFTLSTIVIPPSIGQTTIYGGRGMLRVFSAETVQPGVFYLNSFFFTFLNKRNDSVLEKDYTLNFGLTYGLSPSLELTAQIVPYQDDQDHIWGPPGDTQLGFKLRFPLPTTGLITGVRGFFSFPTAQNHNNPFEPFSSDKVAWGVMGLITLDMTNTFPLFPLKFNINLGYLDHNIKTLFSDEITDQLLLGVGFKFPIKSIIIYTEYTGEIFFNHKEVNFRDNSMRLTQGIKFLGPFNIIIDLAADIGLSRDLTTYPTPLHEYADWKIIGGLSYQFITGRVHKKKTRITPQLRKEEEQKIEKVKRKREKADEDLEKLRKKLEKGSHEKP